MSSRAERHQTRTERQEELQQALRAKQKQLWHLKRRKDSAKNQDEVRAQKREAQRKRREAIKKDPAKYEAAKQKERNRWKKRIDDGKVKNISEMSAREKRIHRKRRRISAKNYRQKKKAEQSAIRDHKCTKCGEQHLESDCKFLSLEDIQDKSNGRSRSNVGSR